MEQLEKNLGTVEVFLPYLGSCAWSNIGQDLPHNDLPRVWAQFFNNAEVQKLPRNALSSLDEARAQSLEFASGQPIGTAKIAAAHQEAHRFVNSILKEYGTKLQIKAATLVASFDYDAVTFCASTSRISGQICWVYQPVAHALYGALIPEILLAHEYFSHLAPQNGLYSRSVTEGWLVVALMRSFQENWGTKCAERWKNTVWYLMREAIEKHLQILRTAKPHPQTLRLDESPRGIDEFALILYGRSVSAFRSFTSALLTEPGKWSSSQLDRLFRKMISDEETWVNRIVSTKTLKINDLFDEI